MLCPKCGVDYEGNSCPRCNAPEILINNEDYLRRRKAYEEKQAGINKSASSDNEASSKGENLDEIYARIKGAGAKVIGGVKKAKVSHFKKKKSTENGDNKVSIVETELISDNEARKNNPTDKKYETRKSPALKKRNFVIVGVILAVAVAAAAIFLNTAKNDRMYFVSGNNVYNVTQGKTKYIADIDDLIFEADDKNFHAVDMPLPIRENVLISSQASAGGKYFAATVYNQENNNYSVMLWNNEIQHKITDTRLQPEILYISENGSVIYTAADILNDEGAVGNYELYIYETSGKKGETDKGTVQLLEENLKRAYVYSRDNILVYLNDSNELYTYELGTGQSKNFVTDEVDCVYTMTNDEDNLYSYKADYVYISGENAGFIYNKSGECYYRALNEKNVADIYIGDVSGTSISFVYENDKYYYLSNDMVYVASKKATVYINDKNELCMEKNSKTQILAENVDKGSLKRVNNSKQGITYTVDGEQYYRNTLTDKAVKIPKLASDKSAMYYNDKLYIITSDGQLCSCSKKGTDEVHMGAAEYCWTAQ